MVTAVETNGMRAYPSPSSSDGRLVPVGVEVRGKGFTSSPRGDHGGRFGHGLRPVASSSPSDGPRREMLFEYPGDDLDSSCGIEPHQEVDEPRNFRSVQGVGSRGLRKCPGICPVAIGNTGFPECFARGIETSPPIAQNRTRSQPLAMSGTRPLRAGSYEQEERGGANLRGRVL